MAECISVSTLVLKSEYWQGAISPEDKEKATLSTGNRFYQFKVMPLGLRNALATFERLMEFVLRGLTWKTYLVFLNALMASTEIIT